MQGQMIGLGVVIFLRLLGQLWSRLSEKQIATYTLAVSLLYACCRSSLQFREPLSPQSEINILELYDQITLLFGSATILGALAQDERKARPIIIQQINYFLVKQRIVGIFNLQQIYLREGSLNIQKYKREELQIAFLFQTRKFEKQFLSQGLRSISSYCISYYIALILKKSALAAPQHQAGSHAGLHGEGRRCSAGSERLQS